MNRRYSTTVIPVRSGILLSAVSLRPREGGAECRATRHRRSISALVPSEQKQRQNKDPKPQQKPMTDEVEVEAGAEAEAEATVTTDDG